MGIQGKPGENYRYVFTKIDKKPQFLIMSKCNFCPFMINDFKNGDAKCAKFINPKPKQHFSRNFLQTVYGYIQKGYDSREMEILTKIDIPTWCQLPDHMTKISPNDAIHSISNGKIFIESGQNYANTIQIISDDEVIISKVDYESLILKPKEDKFIKYGRGKKSNVTDVTIIGETKVETDVCSFCGEDKENIDRYNHLGMCGDCWSKNKFSHPKRYVSKINNFRLKRKMNWTDDEYKLVKN